MGDMASDWEKGKPEYERLSASRYGERMGNWVEREGGRWKRRLCNAVYGRSEGLTRRGLTRRELTRSCGGR